ncbi:hypothetical protein CEXT_590371 [Caerostris extrusa]|uniref:Uncharacterized protein n=1 Tax=Caerostris extrusa TaxID=172846 RepID=A0AAV4WDA9_CAEEX|nr:hypothetical protein CEXT_590371 [Caerostris extrusa]
MVVCRQHALRLTSWLKERTANYMLWILAEEDKGRNYPGPDLSWVPTHSHSANEAAYRALSRIEGLKPN